MIVYIKIDDTNKIIECDTNNFDGYIEIEIDEELFNSGKILNCYYHDGEVVFDEVDYNDLQNQFDERKKISEAKARLEQIMLDNTLLSLDDKTAREVRYLFDKWEPDKDYITGDRKRYDDNLYKCKQDHKSQAQFTPDLIPALWDIIAEEQQGTIDDPIIVPDTISSIVYVKGKYYLEDSVLYLMNREGMADGEEISLTFKPSQLVGHYFEIVEREETK